MTDETSQRAVCSTPRSCGRRSSTALRKLDPRHQVRNPVMFVVEIGAVITTVGWLIQVFGGAPARRRRRAGLVRLLDRLWLWLTVVFANFAEALAEGRGKAQADALRSMRTETVARLRDGGEKSGFASCAAATWSSSRRARLIPGRRHRDRGHRLGRRVGDHRRVGAGGARVRRRPLGGHRRHPGALRPDRGRDHPGARAELPRPDDRPGRGRRAAQDAERDRAQHPARRPDAGLPRRRRHAAPVRRVLRHRRLGRRP